MDNIQKRIIKIIDEHAEEIKEYGDYIWEHAELGYKEFETADYFYNFCKRLGLKTKRNLAVTGVKSYLREVDSGLPTIAIIGELDALPYPGNVDSNPKTGAAHFCGHNAQMAGLMGAMLALSDEDIKNSFRGNIVFFAVPAEEFIEIEYKKSLMDQGEIKYGGGKCELIRIGEFDDIDIALGHHTDPNNELVIANHSTNGFVNKIVKMHGVSSHAAGSPEKGVDALNAAVLGMHALDQQRESFRDEDSVRVHGYISSGGEAMNIIADHVSMQYSVRAKNIDAITKTATLFDRAMKAGAMGNGCGFEISTMPGYLPVIPSPDVSSLDESVNIVGNNKYEIKNMGEDYHQTGSTDFGDVSSIMPLIQFKTGGYGGELHTIESKPVDKELAYIATAKIFALTAYNLLKNENEKANNLINEYRPLFTKEEYLNYMDETNRIDKKGL